MLRTHLIFIIGCENCDRNKKSISSNNGLKCFHFKIRFAILTYSHLLGDPKKIYTKLLLPGCTKNFWIVFILLPN